MVFFEALVADLVINYLTGKLFGIGEENKNYTGGIEHIARDIMRKGSW